MVIFFKAVAQNIPSLIFFTPLSIVAFFSFLQSQNTKDPILQFAGIEISTNFEDDKQLFFILLIFFNENFLKAVLEKAFTPIVLIERNSFILFNFIQPLNAQFLIMQSFLGKNAFRGESMEKSSLKKVVIRSKNIKKWGTMVFGATRDDLVIYVPKSKKAEYEKILRSTNGLDFHAKIVGKNW